jgi:hypothetical protein
MSTGLTDTVIRQQAYLRMIVSTVQNYTVFANRELFPTAGPAISTGGENIAWLADYNATSNGGVMSGPFDAGPEKVPGTSYAATARENAAKLLAADLASAFVADMLLDIDSAGNFSDAAVSRSTYNFASNETTTVGTLSGSDMDEAIRVQSTRQYGNAKPSDLIWMMSSLNHQRVSGFTTGGQYKEFNASSDASGNIDGSAIHRVGSWGSVPIYIENELGDADILLLRKGTQFVADHWTPQPKDVPKDAWQKRELLGMGSNMITTNPRWNGKLSGITG